MQCYLGIHMPCKKELFLSTALGMRTGVETQRKPEQKAFFMGSFHVISINTSVADPGSLPTLSCSFLPPHASSVVSEQLFVGLCSEPDQRTDIC